MTFNPNNPNQETIYEDYHGHPNYFKIYIFLLIFFALSLFSVFLGNFKLTAFIIFLLAAAKAWLVIGNFMHLKFENKFIWIFPFAAIFCVLAFYFGVVLDIPFVKLIISK